jgi:dTDP-4-amino-4,6-dideoxygalactose transaminase
LGFRDTTNLFDAPKTMRHRNPETLPIAVCKIEAAITDRATAMIPIHLGGSAADLDTILAVAQDHKLPVIEDTGSGASCA